MCLVLENILALGEHTVSVGLKVKYLVVDMLSLSNNLETPDVI